MPDKDTERHAIPMASIIHEAENGSFRLEGLRCTACSEVLVSTHRACPKCFSTGTLVPVRLGEKGNLYTYTIVHRSFPGVKTPFISAVIQLEGGGLLKGNLEGVPADPAEIAFDMPLEVHFELAPAANSNRQCVRYVFVPAKPVTSSPKECTA